VVSALIARRFKLEVGSARTALDLRLPRQAEARSAERRRPGHPVSIGTARNSLVRIENVSSRVSTGHIQPSGAAAPLKIDRRAPIAVLASAPPALAPALSNLENAARPAVDPAPVPPVAAAPAHVQRVSAAANVVHKLHVFRGLFFTARG